MLLFLLVCSSHCKIEIEEIDEFDEFEDSTTTVRVDSDLNLNENLPPVMDKVEAEVTVEVLYSIKICSN